MKSKSKSKSPYSLILTVLLLASSKITVARPHAHGVFENLRRLVLPLKGSCNGTPAPTVAAPGYVPELPSNVSPILPTGVSSQAASNVTITAPFHDPSHQPGPNPLDMVLQDGRQVVPHGAHPMIQHHKAHHKHTAKASTSTAAVATAGLSTTYTHTANQISKVKHAARQIQTASFDPITGGYQSWVIGGFGDPPTASTSSPSSRSTLLCPDHNGTVFRSSSGITYQTVCGINYGDDIQQSIHVDSFEACIQECDAYNWDMHGVRCVAAWYSPTTSSSQVDCVLKSSIAHSVYNGSSSFVNAVRYSVAQSAHLPASTTSSALLSSLSETSTLTKYTSSSHLQILSASTPITSSTASPPGVTYGKGNSVITPKVAGSKLHGPSENRPTSQYIQYDSADGIVLSKSLLRAGVNGDLSTGYDLSPQTGVLDVNIFTQNALAPLKNVPHLSRDGGRGGYLNGQHLFLFCDTGSYSGTTSSQNGDFLDFVSSSVAVDVGMNALSGNPIRLQDGIGEWSDNVGRQRGFVPLTQGEQAYNLAMQGQGQRYAIWIESSLIPLDAETALIYAPIVYDNVNMATREANFTYTGNTILKITAGGRGGPVAQRPVRKLFDQDQPEWGVAGGLRSWGPSGIGGHDGKVYLFGGVSGGMLMARVQADSIEDRDAYQYWNGNSWGTTMPGKTDKAFFFEGPIMDIDVFYSPRHLTFIAVYLTIYADSTFYYRYLKADHAIMPGYGPGGDQNSDCVENLLKYEWSDEQVLYKAKPGLGGNFIYSGGIHTRYFGSDDVANGGSRMLLSWTAPTGQNPASSVSEYQIVTAEVNFA